MFDTNCVCCQLGTETREIHRPYTAVQEEGDVQSSVIGVEMTDMMIDGLQACTNIEGKEFETRL